MRLRLKRREQLKRTISFPLLLSVSNYVKDISLYILVIEY